MRNAGANQLGSALAKAKAAGDAVKIGEASMLGDFGLQLGATNHG
jgi:hypothetical protein